MYFPRRAALVLLAATTFLGACHEAPTHSTSNPRGPAASDVTPPEPPPPDNPPHDTTGASGGTHGSGG